MSAFDDYLGGLFGLDSGLFSDPKVRMEAALRQMKSAKNAGELAEAAKRFREAQAEHKKRCAS